MLKKEIEIETGQLNYFFPLFPIYLLLLCLDACFYEL